MEGEFKNLIIVLIIIGALFSGSLAFLSGFVISNGATLPPSVSSTLQSDGGIFNSTASAINIQVSNSSVSTKNLLGGGQSPNVFSSIAATFAVFGGVIVAVFGFISSVPLSFAVLFSLFTNTNINPFAQISKILIGIALAIVGITLTWAVIRAITKVEV